VSLFDLFRSATSPKPVVSVVEAKRKIDSENAFVVDVREPSEWREGHIAGATLVPLSTLSSRLEALPRDRDVLLICRSGNRSSAAQGVLARAGFTRAFNVEGGMLAWQRRRLPIKVGN
jgi:rhodanese-related sulfurtransferase